MLFGNITTVFHGVADESIFRSFQKVRPCGICEEKIYILIKCSQATKAIDLPVGMIDPVLAHYYNQVPSDCPHFF